MQQKVSLQRSQHHGAHGEGLASAQDMPRHGPVVLSEHTEAVREALALAYSCSVQHHPHLILRTPRSPRTSITCAVQVQQQLVTAAPQAVMKSGYQDWSGEALTGHPRLPRALTSKSRRSGHRPALLSAHYSTGLLATSDPSLESLQW